MSNPTLTLEPAWPRHADVAHRITELIRATGPVSYDFQFGPDGRLLDLMVQASWRTPQTLFSAACATLAFVDGEFAGLELGFEGPNFYAFKDNLAALAPDLIQAGGATIEELQGLTRRAAQASYLNAHVPDGVYYLHALSVTPGRRGAGVGARLLDAALERARAAGYRELQLDVLADNPAVAFYRAKGLSVLAEIASPTLSRDHGFPSELRMAVTL
jgi:ribosomal protein S18 acetylase RimI-like enzyme